MEKSKYKIKTTKDFNKYTQKYYKTYFLFFIISLFIGNNNVNCTAKGGTTFGGAGFAGKKRYYDTVKQPLIQYKLIQDYSYNSLEKDLKPQKFVIHGTIVIEQEHRKKEDSTDEKNYPPKQHLPNTRKHIFDGKSIVPQKEYREIIITEKPYIKNILKSFKFTEDHKQNLNNIYIDLSSQTECMNFPVYQCWSSKLEFENEIIDNFHLKIDGIVTPDCKLILNSECTREQGIRCFKLTCTNNLENQKNLYVYTSNKDSKDWLQPQKGIFFMLEKGNYHSSWQVGSFLSPVTLENVKLAHNVIQKFNYYEHFSRDEFLLTFTKINEVTNIPNAFWTPVTQLYLQTIKEYIPLHSTIRTAAGLNAATQLHERVHEYINSGTIGPRFIQYGNRWVYTGSKTVDLVEKDSQFNTELSKSIVFLRETGKKGLLMQDHHGHLGNWGQGAASSSYHHTTFNIGKYTMSVINEQGFYIT